MKTAEILQKYQFNPYLNHIPDARLKYFHRRHISYFKGCRQVLDLGAGRGLFLEELRAAGGQGIGVENHEPSVKEGQAKGLTYCLADLFSFFESAEGRQRAAQTDGVYSSFVLEHLAPGEIFALFDAIKRYCAPGVRVRLITHNPADLSVLGDVFWGDLTHQRLYPGYLLEAMARNRGFTHTHSEVFCGMKLGFRNTLRNFRDRLLFYGHKGKPNLLIDCY